MKFRSGLTSLRTRIIAWSFIPTTIILFAIALVIFYAYQRVTADLVVGRNRELTRLSASQLAADLTEYTGILTAFARTSDIYQGDARRQAAALKQASNRLVVFDAGVLILNNYGRVTAAEPERPEVLGEDWSSRSYFRQIIRSGEPVFSDIVSDGPQGTEVIALAVPILSDQGEPRGTAVGMFRLGATSFSAFYGGIVKLHIGSSGSTFLVDSNGRVIYHSDPSRTGSDIHTQLVVQRALKGQVDAFRTRDPEGREILASCAPVPGTPWGLVNEEDWSALLASNRGYGQSLLLLLVLGVVIPALVGALDCPQSAP